ncbi:MAG: hypothetical protein DWQ06_02155 [Calditrichaeota bacterium]|nr:MAG: hypothetical protein DWQ06_02155 [Calditrichota bacterium]
MRYFLTVNLLILLISLSLTNCENKKMDFIDQVAQPTIYSKEVQPQMKYPDKGMSYKNTFEAELTRKVINLSYDVKKVVFDFTGLDSTFNAEEIEDSEIVKEAILFNGISIGKENLEGKKLLFINSDKFKNLLLKYKPESISRIFYPPFDTLTINNQKQLVKTPDMSLNYIIRFSKDFDNGLSKFPNELRTVKGVITAKGIGGSGTIFNDEIIKDVQSDSTESK